MSDQPARPGGVAPLLLPAVGGMFVVSVLDAAGVIAADSSWSLAVHYGVFGAGGGILVYAAGRRLLGRSGRGSCRLGGGRGL